MSGYRNKYLEMLKAENSEKPLGQELPKLTKGGFVGFVSSQDRPVSDFTPPYDAEGVPCGGAPVASKGSSGGGPSSIRTMTRPAGSVGFAPRLPVAVAPVTSAGCPTAEEMNDNQPLRHDRYGRPITRDKKRQPPLIERCINTQDIKLAGWRDRRRESRSKRRSLSRTSR